MTLVFTGPRRQAAILARILRAEGISATYMFADEPGKGAVFVPGDKVDAEDKLTIERANEQSEIEHDAEGGSA